MIGRKIPLALAVLLASCAAPKLPQQAAPALRPPVILISVDGLRADYLDRGITPNIAALAAGGVKATAMRPSFPSLTFPNHYTLVTGKRPDHHGIVNNTMEDPAIPGVTFTLSNRAAVEDRRWWDEAEPVWVSAEKAGVKTATMFWPGSEAPIHGVRPTQWLPFDGALANPARIVQILKWIDQPQRPAFMTLYFDSVDHDGHEFGPDAPETTRAVAEVDARIGDLVAGLRARGVAANIVLVSDHGMIGVVPDRTIRLDLALPAGSFRIVTAGALAGIEPLPGKDTVLAAALLKPHDHMQCWRKAAIPARLHFGSNPRVPRFVCLAEPGWMTLAGPPRPDARLGGMHGFDPAIPEMAATFVAAGPAFKPGTRLPPFDNVEVYPLVMALIGVKPLPSDGSGALARQLLR
jgi:predicted AlkP superfamily pyrophosphatase or phosphodiesterase